MRHDGKERLVSRQGREKFFNAKLKVLVDEFLLIDKNEDLYWQKYKIGEISVNTLADTLKALEGNRESIVYKLGSTIRRMASEDLDVKNVMAIEICNAYECKGDVIKTTTPKTRRTNEVEVVV